MAKLEPVQLDVITTSDNKGIDEAEKRVLGFSQKAVDASKAVAVGFLGIGTAIAGFAGFGVKMAGDMEAARQGFVALLGSADEADATMSRIKKEAASTPFELPGLVSGTQALAAITKDGDKAIDMLLDVGKAIAVSGKGQAELDRVVLNLQQISSTGKVTAMDIRQFQGSIPIFNDIVKAAGMTVEQLQEADNAAELLGLAFKAAGEKGGIAAEGFTAQAGTWNQLFSNFKDNLGIIAAEFVTQTGIFEGAKAVLGEVVNFLNGLITPESLERMKQLSDWLQKNSGVFVALGLTIATLVAPAFIAWAGAALVAAGALLAATWPVLALIAVGTALYLAWNSNFLGIRDIVNGVVEFITQNIFPSLMNAFGFVQTGLAILYNIFNTTFQLIKLWVGQVVDWIANTAFGKTLIGGFNTVVKKIGEFKVGWDKFWEGVETTVTSTVGNIVKWVSDMVGKIKGFVNEIIKGANTAGKSIPGYIQIPMLADGVNNFSGGLAMVGERGPEIVNLPRGSDVIPNRQVRQMAQNTERPIEINQYIQDSVDLTFAFREIAYAVRTS